MKNSISKKEFSDFVKDIKQKILSHQHEALKTVNEKLIALYWDIGKSVVQQHELYGWGKSIVENLSKEL